MLKLIILARKFMNFNCVFPSCDYKKNDITEEEFVAHLHEKHQNEIQEAAKKENIPVKMIEMMTVSNSRVFINT